MSRIAKASMLYVALVFGAGFVLALVRVPLLVPRLGVRWAELAEMPVMLLVIVWAARYVVRRFGPLETPARMVVGVAALGWLVGAELVLARWLQGLSPLEYLASRDPVSGSVYLAMLLVFAVMPVFIGRSRR